MEGKKRVMISIDIYLCVKSDSSKKKYQVVIAAGFHLFPFRTEKLSPLTPMVLRKWESR